MLFLTLVLASPGIRALGYELPKINDPAPDGYVKIVGQYLPDFAAEAGGAVGSQYKPSEAEKRCNELGAACTGYTCYLHCTLRSGGSLEPSKMTGPTTEVTYKKKIDIASEAILASKGKSSSSVKSKLQGDLVEEWGTKMDGFVPELLLTFPLPPRTDEYFYEDVIPPQTLRGAFFASDGTETSSVDFKILSPAGDVVYEKSAEDGLFHVMAYKKGPYTFMVSNHRWMNQKMVTFALGAGNQTSIKKAHVHEVDNQIQAISKELKDIQSESTFLWIRQKAHMKQVESIHTRVFWFCVVELLILAGVSSVQVYYIKGMLSDRRIL